MAMSVAIKKHEPPRIDGPSVNVGREAVNIASKLTSETLNQKTDEILRDVLRELEKKQQKS
jgi:hypothetical protein